MTENTKELYDQLAVECGEPVNENSFKTVDPDVAEEQVKQTKIRKKFAYEDTETILPDAANTERVIKNTTQKPITKQEAVDNMLLKTAIMKVQTEKDEISKLVDKEEAERVKKDIVEQLLYQQEQAFYVERKHMMDGKTKRRIRKMIERDYDKGKYRPNKSTLND